MAFKFPSQEEVRAERERREALGPEGREAEDGRKRFEEDARLVAKDEAERDAASKELRVVTLAERPYSRAERDGALSVTFYYKDDGSPFVEGDDFSAVKRAQYVPSEADRAEDRSTRGDGVGRKVMDMEAGTVVTLLGEERPRRWKDSNDRWRTVREFHAQRFGEGVLTREQLMEREPGGIAERSERFVAEAGRAKGVVGQAREAGAAGSGGAEPKGAERPSFDLDRVFSNLDRGM